MLEVMAGLVDNDARQGSRKSRITARTPWQLGVALLTLLGAAALPARSLVLHSVFRYNGRLYALLHLYPTARRDEYGLPTISIPEGYKPEATVVALDSPKLQSVTALWLSYRLQRGHSTMYRFSPLL
jgi:hypothetical protein